VVAPENPEKIRSISIKHAIWKVSSKAEPLGDSKLVSEKILEEMIVECPTIADRPVPCKDAWAKY
jgi:hypothetical protein